MTTQQRQNWDREKIKYRLRLKGWTMTALSRHHKYDDGAVSKALVTPWPAVERHVATALGVPAKEIWPDRYLPDGTPRIERRRQKHSTLAASRRHA